MRKIFAEKIAGLKTMRIFVAEKTIVFPVKRQKLTVAGEVNGKGDKKLRY